MKKSIAGALAGAICLFPVIGMAGEVKKDTGQQPRANAVDFPSTKGGGLKGIEPKWVIPGGKGSAFQSENQAEAKVLQSQEHSVPIVSNPASISVLVNKSNALSRNYHPKDLVRPHVKFVFGSDNLEKALLRKEAATALEKIFKRAASQRITLYAVSGFRSYSTQEYLFNQEVRSVGRQKAELVVAKPGTSEHQTGLAMDVSGASVHYTLTQTFSQSKEGRWLALHAHEYGFILRYPKSKEKITKYEFEPWHFRYVGIKTAAAIYHKHITLEEYLGNIKGI
jgi:D-alanyl-D-alanine carboxypeptidase